MHVHNLVTKGLFLTAQDHGCHGGLMDFAYSFIIRNGGLDTEADYKYKAQDGVCNVAKEHRHVVTIDSYEDVPPMNEAALKKVSSAFSSALCGAALGVLPFLYASGTAQSGDCSRGCCKVHGKPYLTLCMLRDARRSSFAVRCGTGGAAALHAAACASC